MFGLCLQPPATVAHVLQRRASFGALKGSVRFETDSGFRADAREESVLSWPLRALASMLRL